MLTLLDTTRFQFTHPGRGATPSKRDTASTKSSFQFTHPGRGATQAGLVARQTLTVSIHAPREGCDIAILWASLPASRFNSRTPGGVRLNEMLEGLGKVGFQFTHPGRGATYAKSAYCVPSGVSIHAPREGCDKLIGRTTLLRQVSIHAPREGCDNRSRFSDKPRVCFNSRTPGGVRRIFTSVSGWGEMFQFTHPGRGATDYSERVKREFMFQFTHPGRGATVWCKVAYYGADKQA